MSAALKLNEEELLLQLENADNFWEKTLLLVDDDPIILEAIKKQALKYYSKIYCFENAERAELFIKNTSVRFDTAIIDYFLPGHLGHEILSYIKKNEGAKIYLITGSLSEVPLKNVKNFDACLPKPIRPARLKEIFQAS